MLLHASAYAALDTPLMTQLSTFNCAYSKTVGMSRLAVSVLGVVEQVTTLQMASVVASRSCNPARGMMEYVLICA